MDGQVVREDVGDVPGEVIGDDKVMECDGLWGGEVWIAVVEALEIADGGEVERVLDRRRDRRGRDREDGGGDLVGR